MIFERVEVANIEEGFEQSTDRGFPNFLYTSKGSTAEARKRLKRALHRGYLDEREFTERGEIGDEVARLTVGLIKYLRRSNRRDRGLGKPEPQPPLSTPRREFTVDANAYWCPCSD